MYYGVPLLESFDTTMLLGSLSLFGKNLRLRGKAFEASTRSVRETSTTSNLDVAERVIGREYRNEMLICNSHTFLSTSASSE